MTMLQILHLLGYFIFFYLAFNTIYLFIFAVSGLFPLNRTSSHQARQKRKFIVLIPGYREDEVIIDVAQQALKQDYGTENYDVAIIADGFKKETIAALKQFEVKVFEVQLAFSTKSRALNAALDQLDDNYQVAVVLDADNIMAPDFLSRINRAFDQGYMAVQGHRVAKNLDSSFAILDAVSEEINNHIFRKGHRVLRLSSALIGSAMAFEYPSFKKMMKEVEVVGGFDKEIEVRLLAKKQKIEYLPNAYVYDEKVPNAKVFTKQRRRWISAQIHYFGKSFLPALHSLLTKGNIDYFNKALQFVLLPRIMLISILFLITLFYTLLGSKLELQIWLSLFGLGVLVFLLSIPRYFYHLNTLKALKQLPFGILLMFLSLLKIKDSNKEFLHTKHTYNAFQIKHPRFVHKNHTK
jgi:cellulose synthase/poly-beta-1,6-N-acetylglucosamine synthase-like glycosyltransferase